jgi:putative Ca2+/H+ antiporter (TMEM165/GDT1 family)
MDNLQSHLERVLSSLHNVNVSGLFHSSVERFLSLLTITDVTELSTTAMASFALIAAAEMGDKSQLVCMVLASKHRAMPVLLGAIGAFALLNTLAVVFGVAIASWLPDTVVALTVGLLFAAFGVHSLRWQKEDENELIKEKSGHGIFFTTFLLITVAEFGDKTQLAVVALSSTAAPLAVWLGSTFALALTTALGILAGRTVLQKISLVWLHKISGSIFLALSGVAFYRAYMSEAL